MPMRMPRRGSVVPLLCGLVAVALAAPATGAAQDRGDTSFTIGRNAVVDITVRSGNVLVRGSDRDAGELRSNSGGYTLKSSGVGIIVGTRSVMRSPVRSLRNDDTENARLELLVPRGVRVVISAGRADVEVRDIEGEVEVRSSSGDITMSRLGGRVIVETLSGDLTIDGGAGGLRVTTSSGDVIARGLRGEANVHTTSGDVTLSGFELPSVAVESISGDASFEGSMTPDGRLTLSTHNGDVLLRLADGLRGELEFFTHTGEMNTAIPLTMSGAMTGLANSERRPGQRFLFGGGGAARLSISTFNGDVRIERGPSRTTDR
jgi:DUF4097 and DUF4098 domain-containing protein YvlB